MDNDSQRLELEARARSLAEPLVANYAAAVGEYLNAPKGEKDIAQNALGVAAGHVTAQVRRVFRMQIAWIYIMKPVIKSHQMPCMTLVKNVKKITKMRKKNLAVLTYMILRSVSVAEQ